MLLHEIAEGLTLEHLTPTLAADRPVLCGYAADLLSCVMAAAKAGTLWVTLQAHPNVVAVAGLTNMAGVIVTENAPVGPETLARAQQEGIPFFRTAASTFTVVAQLAALGIPGVENRRD